ncbi:D-alanyl-D-alanine carboxypeptidase/D-alanyl-D-alanine-endopeptidase [Cloacibacterium sp.]|uniref:D-alanyl-D-alanine carboxypeptidase/D-alanyl-D-alanine endopeptidase n=1 Tax=Cloacibacterium sp. TaxID=1913682 RepID=UPI0035B2F89D
MKTRFFLFFFSVFQSFFAQKTIQEQLDVKVNQLLASEPMYSGSLSFYVSDESGNKIYEYQANKGLSTASTMKIFTAAAALETLGKDYQYKTKIAFDGNLYITSNGDPTLGNDRFEGYKADNFKQKVIETLKQNRISKISGDLIIDDTCFDFQKIPGGWPWNDMGNYYGAGVWGVNWRENVFEINTFGKEIKNFSNINDVKWVNELRTEGNSDKSIIYTAPYSDVVHINGSLPAKDMKVSGAMPNPPKQLAIELAEEFKKQKIAFNGKIIINSEKIINGEKPVVFPENKVILEYKSPTLDKIVYWFLKKSVNLFGETFIKTMAKEKTDNPSFESGVKYLKNFWKDKGIDQRMINFVDGSGLSPQNYASSKAEVQALLWAKKQPWFDAYYDGFPVMANGMKMKSGSIKDSRAFAGFHTSATGKNYVFSIIMNNYQANDLSNALYNVLNVLK